MFVNKMANPSKTDIEAIFNRLRLLTANKMCFDCNAKNPTWASVTYGVFICIDCSAVHRGLGVHLTFVRSTQLDTNWTWVQLRQMQLGGNANATQFFAQHNCVTTDAQKKYNSRAAQLYRDKLHQMALNSIQTHPDTLKEEQYSNGSNKLHFHPHVEHTTETEKEVDFFEEHEKNNCSSDVTSAYCLNPPAIDGKLKTENEYNDTDQPNVNFDHPTEERKPTIGVRKVQPKKTSLGGKKGGLGATKVKTNFAELEREAAAADEARVQASVEQRQKTVPAAEEEAKQMTSMRLAYQDLSVQQKRHEDHLKRVDPKKAEQVERLGMGFNTRSGVSHSVLNDMKTIEQENLQTNTSTLSKFGRVSDIDGFFDDFTSLSTSGFNMNRSTSGYNYTSKQTDSFYSDNNGSSNNTSSLSHDWVIEPALSTTTPARSANKTNSSCSNNNVEKRIQSSTDDSDLAQKKFAGAKAISSDQFFQNRNSDEYEHNANLNRFQGSSSISSSDFFGTKETNNGSSNFHPPDLDDVRESVRQGVTKVAGKISSLANGVMSSIQDRYGY